MHTCLPEREPQKVSICGTCKSATASPQKACHVDCTVFRERAFMVPGTPASPSLPPGAQGAPSRVRKPPPALLSHCT